MVLELDSRGQISVFISHQMILKWILQDLFPQDPPRPSSALTFSRSWRISSETIDPPVTGVILLISRIWWPRESCRIVPRIPVSNDGKTLSDLMSFKLMDLSIRIACWIFLAPSPAGFFSFQASRYRSYCACYFLCVYVFPAGFDLAIVSWTI